MEIQLSRLKSSFGLDTRTVVHAGANLCQEKDFYLENGVTNVIWIEGIPEVARLAKDMLSTYPGQIIFEAALWSESGEELSFNVTSNRAESSSLLSLKLHRALHPTISSTEKVEVTTVTLDDFFEHNSAINPTSIDLLILDLQGAEYAALLGSKNTLLRTNAIHIEVSSIELYSGQHLFDSIDEFLGSYGFCLVDHDLSETNFSGDALYVRSELTNGHQMKALPSMNPKLNLSWKGRAKFLAVRVGIPARYLGKFWRK